MIEPLTPHKDGFDRRMVAVVQAEDGRLRLDADVRVLVHVDYEELREREEDLVKVLAWLT